MLRFRCVVLGLRSPDPVCRLMVGVVEDTGMWCKCMCDAEGLVWRVLCLQVILTSSLFHSQMTDLQIRISGWNCIWTWNSLEGGGVSHCRLTSYLLSKRQQIPGSHRLTSYLPCPSIDLPQAAHRATFKYTSLSESRSVQEGNMQRVSPWTHWNRFVKTEWLPDKEFHFSSWVALISS